LFNDTISVNASILAKIDNNTITLYIEITFESPNVTSDNITQLCQALKGQLEPVSNTKFQQCVIHSASNRYPAGSTATMTLQSEQMNNDDNPSAGGAMGLTSSIIAIGFTYILHFLFLNL